MLNRGKILTYQVADNQVQIKISLILSNFSNIILYRFRCLDAQSIRWLFSVLKLQKLSKTVSRFFFETAINALGYIVGTIHANIL